MTGRLSVSVVPKSPVTSWAEVLEVLDEDRAVVAGRVDPLGDLSAVSRPPAAAVIGSPVDRIRKNTRVTRMKIVGKIRRNLISMYLAQSPAALFLYRPGRRRRVCLNAVRLGPGSGGGGRRRGCCGHPS